MPPKARRTKAATAAAAAPLPPAVVEALDLHQDEDLHLDLDPEPVVVEQPPVSEVEAEVIIEGDGDRDPVVLQLDISSSRMNDLIQGEDIKSILKYNPNITEPEAYIPDNHFVSNNESAPYADEQSHMQMRPHAFLQQQPPNLQPPPQDQHSQHDTMCFWCCHNIIDTEYGMPIRYDATQKSFTLHGSFCSLECAAAYNYSVNMGSNKVWEIHSWIQLLGKKYGFAGVIRPAPSKYLLKMFNGPMTIEEFRKAHCGFAQTCIINIPPFIHINSQTDIINTSFLSKTKSGTAPIQANIPEEVPAPAGAVESEPKYQSLAPAPKRRLTKADSNTLEQKMKLVFT